MNLRDQFSPTTTKELKDGIYMYLASADMELHDWQLNIALSILEQSLGTPSDTWRTILAKLRECDWYTDPEDHVGFSSRKAVETYFYGFSEDAMNHLYSLEGPWGETLIQAALYSNCISHNPAI